jgi:hypothetical protein
VSAGVERIIFSLPEDWPEFELAPTDAKEENTFGIRDAIFMLPHMPSPMIAITAMITRMAVIIFLAIE